MTTMFKSLRTCTHALVFLSRAVLHVFVKGFVVSLMVISVLNFDKATEKCINYVFLLGVSVHACIVSCPSLSRENNSDCCFSAWIHVALIFDITGWIVYQVKLNAIWPHNLQRVSFQCNGDGPELMDP